ncbi:TPR-like protein [Rhizoclosmatium globosum]|uniref:TPR-like protein n=1 Tax=Rhizoclosmatium globosum TaxID=329046 RepID=A0A1Y2CKR0_9FUNG|nr:TPR-like protein [Rhizoclosmatium globosum]|eukprot:ORY47609.1 TPR-like protein [Rhizoclosmatium globosum]
MSETFSLNPRNAALAVFSVAAVAVGVWMLAAPTAKKQQKIREKKIKKSVSSEQIDDVAPAKEAAKEAAAAQPSEPTAAAAAPVAQTEETKESDPATLAKEAKTIGNRLFGEKKYKEAIEYYTTAISLLPTDPVFFANRAACYSNLNDHVSTIADCNSALELDNRYIKAIYRRAQAYDATGEKEKALNDYTAICMLEEFKKESSIATTDRLLKDVGTLKASKAMETKVARLPSETFVKAYMDSFRPKNFGASIVAQFPKESTSDVLLHKAYDAVLARDWATAMKTIEESVETNAFSSDKVHAFALNTLGTFCFLKGDIPLAMQHLDKSLSLDSTSMNTLIKRASIFMERQDLESALREYENAEKVSSTDPDLYYHRGQVRFLTGDVHAAIGDYKRSLELDNDFVYAHIQLAVAQYKNQDQGQAEKTFLKALKKFADIPEVFNYYGEVLLDMGRFEEAEKNFDKAIEMDGTSPLPYINKSILYLQAKQDPESAEKFCKQAAQVDPTCDIAYIQLAQLLIHQNRLQDALDAYDSAIHVTRTEPELVNAISCREACAAQLYVSNMYPDVYAKLRGAAAAAGGV